ncbi:sporulation inhibitor of replication protein SirA [Ornithinibacillus caprae]|uniref:sporulation inhibitor of replication protein SirA n=1 Tax=Ornithinibacillus caprae TaxID=2678566 RepID=UPI0018C70A6F|nr:sporulation inhibitor of replication protein SirA [Ornithinibacillus caprae]
MKEFSIYWIKEEFASHYFYKSDILYRFIKSYQKEDRRDLSLQFDYITNNFPSQAIISNMKWYLTNHATYQIDGNEIKIQEQSNNITLHIHEKHIKFRCESLQDAEKLLFPVLRLIYPFLFIVDDHLYNFGWISPVTISMMHHGQQVLYSYG